jgi:hypothetical protein
MNKLLVPVSLTEGDNWKTLCTKLFLYFIQECFICRPSESTVSEDAGKLGSNPGLLSDALTTRLDLIYLPSYRNRKRHK